MRYIAALLILIVGLGLGYYLAYRTIDQQKQRTCIDWLHLHSDWRYTMCNLPADGK